MRIEGILVMTRLNLRAIDLGLGHYYRYIVFLFLKFRLLYFFSFFLLFFRFFLSISLFQERVRDLRPSCTTVTLQFRSNGAGADAVDPGADITSSSPCRCSPAVPNMMMPLLQAHASHILELLVHFRQSMMHIMLAR